jgi:hypothetical protein
MLVWSAVSPSIPFCGHELMSDFISLYSAWHSPYMSSRLLSFDSYSVFSSRLSRHVSSPVGQSYDPHASPVAPLVSDMAHHDDLN